MLHATVLSVVVTPNRSLDDKLRISLKFGKCLIQYVNFQSRDWSTASADHSDYYKELSIRMCFVSILVALI